MWPHWAPTQKGRHCHDSAADALRMKTLPVSRFANTAVSIQIDTTPKMWSGKIARANGRRANTSGSDGTRMKAWWMSRRPVNPQCHAAKRSNGSSMSKNLGKREM